MDSRKDNGASEAENQDSSHGLPAGQVNRAMRPLIVHYHLFKNAGTSVDEVFRRSLGSVHHLEAEDPDATLDDRTLAQFVLRRPEVLYVSSHALKPPRPVIVGIHVVDLIFLRHPVDRFRSVHDFSRRNGRDGPTEQAARRYGLADFATWMACETPWNFFDPQTSILANRGDAFYPPGPADFWRAMSTLQGVRLLGTVERFDDAFLCAQRYLRGILPGLRFSLAEVPPQNATAQRRPTLEERVAEVERALGPRYEHLAEALQLDLRLWQAAGEELARRYRAYASWPALSP